jgi:hypothetical protein
MIKVDGSVVTLSVQNIPIGLHVMYLYFPDMTRTLVVGKDGLYVTFIKDIPSRCPDSVAIRNTTSHIESGVTRSFCV